MASTRMAVLAQNIVTSAVGLAIAFSADWRLSLVVLACAPVIALSGQLQMSVFTGQSASAAKSLEKVRVVLVMCVCFGCSPRFRESGWSSGARERARHPHSCCFQPAARNGRPLCRTPAGATRKGYQEWSHRWHWLWLLSVHHDGCVRATSCSLLHAVVVLFIWALLTVSPQLCVTLPPHSVNKQLWPFVRRFYGL